VYHKGFLPELVLATKLCSVGLKLKKAHALLVCLLVPSLVLAFPNVYAQSTRIYELVQPIHVVAGGQSPIEVTAIVYYNNTTPGNYLYTGIIDQDTTPHEITPGIVTSSPDSCLNQPVLAALCVIGINTASGVEHLDFKIGGILGGKHGLGTWDLNMTTALFDPAHNLIQKTTSTVLFGIRLTPLALKVTVPASVAVSVDGVQKPPGPTVVGVVLGEHNISVPALVQVSPTTRLKFDHWPDGSTDTNRTIFITSDTNITIAYVTQNLLTLAGPQATSTGAGWYNEGETATFSVAQTEPIPGLLGSLGGKMKFQGWYENGQLLTSSTTGTISMNQPHTLTAVCQADYSEPSLILTGILIIFALAYLMVRRRTNKPARRRPHRRRTRVKRRS
jgi:hypothetical protein